LLVSAICLALVLYLADLRRMVEALRLADYRLIALVFLIALVWLAVRGLVWRTLLEEKATYSQVFLTINEGYLLNNILPFRLGELARAYLLGRKAHLEFLEVLPSIIIERFLDLGMATGLLLITLPFVVGGTWAFEAAVSAGLVVCLGLGGLYVLARNREWAVALFEKLAARFPTVGRLGSRQVPAFFIGLAVLTDGKRFLRAIAWILLDWLIAMLQFYLIILAFFPGAKPLWGGFTLGVVSLGIAAPSSPGAVGVMELSMVGALSVFGLDRSVSLAAALTAHLVNYILTGFIGAIALFRDGMSLTGLYNRMRDFTPDHPA